jgi:hypothetical protein
MIALALLLSVQTPHPAMRVAVADLESKGVDAKLNKIFLDSLLAELRKLQHASVIGMDEVRAMLDLEAQKQILGCGEEKSCLAEIAGAVGADVLIVGGLVDVGGETVLSLKRIDQKSAAVAQQVSVRLAHGNGEEVLAAVGPSVEKLFPELPLRPGEKRGVSPEMALRLNPPPVPVWGFITSASIAGVGVLLTGTVFALWAASQQSYKDLASSAVAAPVAGVQLVDKEHTMRDAEAAMWTCAAVTVVAGAVTGALAPFTDWQGYAKAE